MKENEKTRLVFSKVETADTGPSDLRTRSDAAGRPFDRRPSLLALSGVAVGRLFTIGAEPMTIGRTSDCEICLRELEVSRRHARLERDVRGKVVIRDLGGSNGTHVNGARIARCTLQAGDRVLIGRSNILQFGHLDKLERTFLRSQYSQTLCDDLTGLFNRRHFLAETRRELAYALRNVAPTSLVLFDIDHFKLVNDTFGHAAGDYVLKDLAKRVKAHLRVEDLLARFGGDEFAMLLRGQSAAHAFESAERIRQMVESSMPVWEGREVPMTISIGIASRDEKDLSDVWQMLRRADDNLYAAKSEGRNRIVGPAR